MKATLEVKLKSFLVPNYVLADVPPGKREDGFDEGPKYPLSDLDALTLDALCEEFTCAVFKKAGKQRPPQCGCG